MLLPKNSTISFSYFLLHLISFFCYIFFLSFVTFSFFLFVTFDFVPWLEPAQQHERLTMTEWKMIKLEVLVFSPQFSVNLSSLFLSVFYLSVCLFSLSVTFFAVFVAFPTFFTSFSLFVSVFLSLSLFTLTASFLNKRQAHFILDFLPLSKR